MADRPIIFSARMVEALLVGQKTQTRRIIKNPVALDALALFAPAWLMLPGNADLLPCVDGDRLWVRETFALESDQLAGPYPAPHDDGRPIFWIEGAEPGERYWLQPHYRASDPDPDLCYADAEGPSCRWKPSIHMPRWASRLTLTVRDVRVQRLHEISEADAIAEGCPARTSEAGQDPRGWFAGLWDTIHGAGAWIANPYVAAISFTVERRNIDAPADCRNPREAPDAPH